MNNKEYLSQLSALTGLRHYPGQGPWSGKAGSLIGAKDGYLAAVGIAKAHNSAALVILLRFQKSAQPEMLKTLVEQNAALKKQGKLAQVGPDFLRWQWTYSFSKPKLEEAAQLLATLVESLKGVVTPFANRCENCQSSSSPDLMLMNGLPVYYCSSCREKVRQEQDQVALQYEAIEPNYPNGILLGAGAALAGALAWGGIAYSINRIFLWGAIGIGYLVALGIIKGTGKVTRLGQILTPVLTLASILFGDAIFFTLSVMKQQHIPFSGHLLKVILLHFVEIEREGGGAISLLFALGGAAYAVYAARKPEFSVKFEPLTTAGN
ncbi:MAG: hypothetical protein LAN71_05305 [Acidobacteriia bacterium]|nr:hypothetical protein [Terriglobia bacterium]